MHNLDYAVFSVDPLTQNQRQYNAILYKRLSPDVESRLSYQLSTQSQGLINQPVSSARLRQFHDQLAHRKVRRRAERRSVQQRLAGRRDGLCSTAYRQSGHPFDMQLNVNSFEDEFRFFRYVACR